MRVGNGYGTRPAVALVMIAGAVLSLLGSAASVCADDCWYGPTPELMAFRQIISLTPDSALTAEIRADLDAIYGAWPFFRTICARPAWRPSEVIIDFDDATAAAYHAGEFHGFDDLHASLGALAYARTSPWDSTRVTFEFEALYHPVVLADLHQAVAGVLYACPNAIGAFDCEPTDVEREQPHVFHFHETYDTSCLDADWWIRVRDGVPEFLYGDSIPVPDAASSWGALKQRF